MSLEIIKESFRINQVVGKDSSQTIVENDIIVPDIKPDIGRILLLDGDVYVNGTEIVQERVLINGTIFFKILYVPDGEDKCIKSINTNGSFSCSVDVPNAEPGMKCKTACTVEYFDYSLVNSRKINVKTIMDISCKVTNEAEFDIINDLKGIDNIQVLKDSIKFNRYIGDNSVNCVIREAMEVPPGKPAIKEILRNDVKITGKDYKITDDKIVAKGEVNILTLYISDDEDQSIQFMEHEVPFTQFVDLPGVSEDSACEVEYRIADLEFYADEDSDGELRILNGEIGINLCVSAFNKSNVYVLSDAYSPRSGFNFEKELFSSEDVVTESRSQIVLKDTVALEDGSPEILEVFNVLCKPSLSEYKITDDKITVEGVVESSVLYLANNADQPVFCHRQDIPFRHNIEIKGVKPDMECNVDLDVEHCNYSVVSGNEIEIRLVVGMCLKVVKQVALPLIVKVSECPVDEKKLASQPSIVIYFAQPGDTLWKVAKKYYTTMEDLKAVNNLSDFDAFTPGQQVIIPKRW